MRISFDLDDTLICYQEGVPRETPLVPLLNFLLNEPMRQGTRALIADLQSRGCDVSICTSSSRSPLLVRLWLALYGVRVRRIITQETYERHLKRFPDNEPPSKNPRAFGIDLHIDDSEGVRLEGERYGFDVLVVAPDDTGWAQKVLETSERRLRR